MLYAIAGNVKHNYVIYSSSSAFNLYFSFFFNVSFINHILELGKIKFYHLKLFLILYFAPKNVLNACFCIINYNPYYTLHLL